MSVADNHTYSCLEDLFDGCLGCMLLCATLGVAVIALRKVLR